MDVVAPGWRELPEANRGLVIRLLAVLLARRAADRVSAGPVMALWAAALIPDSRLKGFLRCELPVQVLVVDLNRDPVAEP